MRTFLSRPPALPLGSRRGFSMVEIVVCIAIVGMIMVGGLYTATSVNRQRLYREPSAKIQEFARKARYAAVLQQRPYQLEITNKSVTLTPARNINAATGEDVGRQRQGTTDRFQVEGDDINIFVRGWRDREFVEAGQPFVWVFEHSGLCEPITTRIEGEMGFIELTFNPLDAHVESEESELR